MSEPKLEELTQSIEELSAYRERLRKEIMNIAQKLRMPKKKIDATLEEHSELAKLDKAINQLINQREKGKV